MKENFVPIKKKIEVATPKIVSGEANIAGEVYDVSEQEDVVVTKKNETEKFDTKATKKVQERKLTDAEYGDLQESFIERLPSSEVKSTEKKLTDEEYGELQASFIDRLPSNKTDNPKEKKSDAKVEDGVGKGETLAKKVVNGEDDLDEIIGKTKLDKTKVARKKIELTEEEENIIGKISTKLEGASATEKIIPDIQTWETFKNKKYPKREGSAMVGGRVFGEKKDPTVPGQGESLERTEARLEQEKQLEMLQSLVAEKRKAYATADYRSETLFTKIRGVLGLKNENMPANAKDSLIYQQYHGALNELRNLQIQMMRDEYANIDALPPAEKAEKMTKMKKEMGEMATYFGVCEKLDLAGARTEARTEAWTETRRGRFGEAALKRSAEVINWYRKLDPRVKIALSVSLMAGGLGAAAMGSFGVASVVGGTKLLQRWLGGAALGVGVAGGLEARSRTRTNRKVARERDAIVENSEASWQEQLQALNEYCGNEMKNFHNDLQTEKYGATRRKLLGAGVGVFVGSGAAAECLKFGFGKIGETETFGKVKDVASEYWKSSGASGLFGAGVENGLRDTPTSKLSPSAGGMEEKFGMDEKFGPKQVPSDIENGLKDSPSSKLASKVGGMYDEIADKVKGVASNFEKNYLQETPSSKLSPSGNGMEEKFGMDEKFGPKQVPSDIENGLRDTPSSKLSPSGNGMEEKFGMDEKFGMKNVGEVPANPNIKDLKINGSIEKTIIGQLQGQGVSKADAGKFAHKMVLDYIKDLNSKGIKVSLENLNLVQPEDSLKLNIDPNNLKGSGIISFERASDNLHTGEPKIPSGGAGYAPIREAMSASQSENPLQNPVEDNIIPPEGSGTSDIETRNQAHGMADGDRMHQTEVNSYQRVFGNSGPEILRNVQAMPESLQMHREELLNLGGLEKAAEEAYNRALADTNDVSGARGSALDSAKKAYENAYAKAFNTIAKETFSDYPVKGGIAGLKNIPANEFFNGDGAQNQRIIELKSYIAKQYGEEFSNPTSNESAFRWVNRMIQKTLESGGVEYKSYKLLDTGRG